MTAMTLTMPESLARERTPVESGIFHLEKEDILVGIHPVKLFDEDGVEIYAGPAEIIYVRKYNTAAQVGVDYFTVRPLEEERGVYRFRSEPNPSCKDGVLQLDVEQDNDSLNRGTLEGIVESHDLLPDKLRAA